MNERWGDQQGWLAHTPPRHSGMTSHARTRRPCPSSRNLEITRHPAIWHSNYGHTVLRTETDGAHKHRLRDRFRRPCGHRRPHLGSPDDLPMARLVPDATHFVSSSACELPGGCTRAAVIGGIAHVLWRYDVLRTLFTGTEQDLRQVVQGSGRMAVPVYRASGGAAGPPRCRT